MQLSTEGNPKALLSRSSYYLMMLKGSLEDTWNTGLQEDSHGSCISKGIYALSTMSGTHYTLHNTSVQSLSHVQLFATDGLQHARLPCPSLTSRGCSKACPLSRWCHPTISSSVVPFSFYCQSLPASRSFPRVSPSHQVAKVSEFQFQHQSFQWIFRTDFL